MGPKSDSELIADFKNGDVTGFNELVRRHQQSVYWVARRIVGRHEEADDVAQEVFVKIYEALKHFRNEARFSTWLYRIATNMSLNALRKNRLREFVNFEDAAGAIADSSDGPIEEMDHQQYEGALKRAIDRLPKKQKAVFVLRYYEELPYEKMASILKRSVGGLKANYFHALKKIQKYVLEELGS